MTVRLGWRAAGAGLALVAAPVAAVETGAADAAELEAEAESALVAGKNDVAKAALQRILALPENVHTARALELLGLTQQRSGDEAGARQSYNDYLKRFAGTEGSRRVEQRLASLSKPAAPGNLRPPPIAFTWKTDLNGVASQFYYRDESRSIFTDPRRVGLGGTIDRRDNVDQVLTAVDATLTASNEDVRLEARAAGLFTRDFRHVPLVGAVRGNHEVERITSLYFEVQDGDRSLSARAGRQQLFGAGVFGRFDGVQALWQASPAVRLHAVAGAPVITTRTTAVDTGQRFYGVSAEYAWPGRRLWTSLYWLDQRAGGRVDRQAVGAEVRLTLPRLLAYGVVDYDVHFGQLSQALLSANYVIDAKTSATVSLDSLHYPLLTTTNAVIGQAVPSLDVVSNRFDPATLRQLALDRTTVQRSMSLTLSRKLSARWQVDTDLVLVGTSASRASAGVNAIDATGLETYFGGQLIGNGLILGNDTLTFGAHFADVARFRLYSVDAYVRLPISARLILDIGTRAGYRDDKVGNGYLRSVQPWLRILYRVSDATEIDVTGGGSIIDQRYGDTILDGPRHETGWLLNAGYRIAF